MIAPTMYWMTKAPRNRRRFRPVIALPAYRTVKWAEMAGYTTMVRLLRRPNSAHTQ